MHTDTEGAQILRAGRIARFARIEDHDYDLIRETAGAPTLNS
jgi:hypothetical protein